MKRLLMLGLAWVALATGAAGATGATAQTIKVGVTSGPHAQILEVVKENAAKAGLDVEIVEFSDYIQPNAALAAGDLDANSYQHRPFLEAQIKAKGYDLVPVGKTTLFPIGLYSKRYKSLAAVPDGARIAIPNDPSNETRVLLLLQDADLVTVKPDAGFNATPLDLTANPRKLDFVELEAPQLPHVLDDVDLAAVNTNFAIEAKLNPKRDALLLEGPQSQYTCELVVRREDRDKPWVKVLVTAYQQDNVKDFINRTFGGAAIPGW